MSEIRADVELTEADYVEAYLAYARDRNLFAGMQKLMAVLAVTTVAVVMAWGWPPTPGVWTAMVVALLAGIYLARYQWVWAAKRAFASLPEARRRYTVTFSDDEVHQQGPRALVRFSFATLRGWLETDNLIVVLGSTGVAAHWAKRHFDAAQLTALRALLDARVVLPPPAMTTTNADAPKGQARKTLILWFVLVGICVAVYSYLRVNP